MKNLKSVLLMLALGMLVSVNYSYGQVEVVVRARPPIPHYERVVAPSPRHVWIDEDWEPRGGAYVFVGGHWAEPPHPGWMWVPGHWAQRPRGEVWIRGHWRHR